MLKYTRIIKVVVTCIINDYGYLIYSSLYFEAVSENEDVLMIHDTYSKANLNFVSINYNFSTLRY